MSITASDLFPFDDDWRDIAVGLHIHHLIFPPGTSDSSCGVTVALTIQNVP